MKNTFITKSRYLDGLQCAKLLWCKCNAKGKIPPDNVGTQARFDQGRDVELYAHKLFPDGIAVEGTTELARIAAKSQSLLAERKPLFEAGFIYQDVYARADILNPAAHGKWDIIEIKSAASVKDINYHDLALQRFCYEGAGVPISRCNMMYINNKYVRQGPIEPEKLFCRDDVTETVNKCAGGIKEHLRMMRRIIELKKCPEVRIGPQCRAPHDCPMISVCWAFLPEKNVATFCGMRKKKVFTLIDRGIYHINDVPVDISLSHKQHIQRECYKTGKPHVNRSSIVDFLSLLKFPLYFLDFETLSSAIPRYDNTMPFKNIPFQFSLHIWESPDTEPIHHEHLADGTADPRPEILNKLKTLLGKRGSVVCYNVAFEKARLRECTAAIPGYQSWFTALERRFVDLYAPFRAFHYYHSKQDGGTGIKVVLPVLTDKSYAGMEIAGGDAAASEYDRVTFGDVPAAERQRVRKALLQYCELDTLGMIDIIRALMVLVK
jgi:hypothetical protein